MSQTQHTMPHYGINKVQLIPPYPVMSTGKPISFIEGSLIRRISEPVKTEVSRETVKLLTATEIPDTPQNRLNWMLSLRNRPYHTYDSAVGIAYRFLKEVVG